MSTYKVPQDVEAEDKLLGPLTLKQFIFAIITILLCYLAFLAGKAQPLLVIPFLPGIALFGYLAAPFQRDQPTDVYLGARLRFLLKPRRRVWDQAGMEELVRITVPKKIEHQYSNGLNQREVRSRLEILATTIDSRGWATKNAYVNDSSNDLFPSSGPSDRLVPATALPQMVPDSDITAADDILDPNASYLAHHMDELASKATSSVRDAALTQMQSAQAGQPVTAWNNQAAPYQSSATQPSVITPTQAPPTTPTTTVDNGSTMPFINAGGAAPHYDPYPSSMRQHVLDPSKSHRGTPAKDDKATTVSLPESAKLELSQRDDLNLDVIAREADRVASGDGDEVVIKLH